MGVTAPQAETMEESKAEHAPRALPVVNTPRPTPLPLAPPEAVPQLEEELRTSNGVEGFRYSRWKGIWYVLRMFLALPLIPLWPFFVARDMNDWSLARNYVGTMKYLLRTIVIHLRHGSIIRMIRYNLFLGPDEVNRRIATRDGACTRCAKCCKQYDCIFLGEHVETKEYYCKAYETDYWFYGTCGRYPLDQRDIDAHACPGFSFLNDEEPVKTAA